MNAAPAKKTNYTAPLRPLTNHARHAALPMHEYITVMVDASGKSNAEIAREIGYPKPNVISMLKKGSMRLAPNKVLKFAKAVGADPIHLMGLVLGETHPGLWEALLEILGDKLVSESEQALLAHLRASLDGYEPDYVNDLVFIRALAPLLQGLVEREEKKVVTQLEEIRRRQASRAAARKAVSND